MSQEAKRPTCRTGYECGICSCYHPADWDGDCRDDANRYADADDFDELIDMDDVDEWRRQQRGSM